MRVRILPYKGGSRSAKALSEALGALRLHTRNSRFRARPGDVVINWGSGSSIVPSADLSNARIINEPIKVANASNKLTAFGLMKDAEVPIPEFWTDRGDIPEDAYPVVCRTILSGHSGAGIVIADDESELVYAPLYVKYVNKTQEFRVHVGGGESIGVQRKARSYAVQDEDVNWQIRNHSNGFVFVRQNLDIPEGLEDAAIKAVTALGLDFGAVDVIYHPSTGSTVLEVNTAPGLEGQTIDEYVEYFRRITQ